MKYMTISYSNQCSKLGTQTQQYMYLTPVSNKNTKINNNVGCAISHVVSCRPLTREVWFHTWVSPFEICGGQSGTGTGSSL